MKDGEKRDPIGISCCRFFIFFFSTSSFSSFSDVLISFGVFINFDVLSRTISFADLLLLLTWMCSVSLSLYAVFVLAPPLSVRHRRFLSKMEPSSSSSFWPENSITFGVLSCRLLVLLPNAYFSFLYLAHCLSLTNQALLKRASELQFHVI